MLDGKPKKKIKVGEKFERKAGRESLVILAVHKVDGGEFITFHYKTSGAYSSSGVTTYNRSDFDYYYKRVEDFFVVGGEYRSDLSGVTYYVQEVFTISSPVFPSYRKQARAVGIDSEGGRWMEMLNLDDFKNKKRIK